MGNADFCASRFKYSKKNTHAPCPYANLPNFVIHSSGLASSHCSVKALEHPTRTKAHTPMKPTFLQRKAYSCI